MNKPTIEANICEIKTGDYHQVKLYAVPRAGELIKLFSFVEKAAGRPPEKQYEVVRVEHELCDVCDDVVESKAGHHFVNVWVKPSTDFQKLPPVPDWTQRRNLSADRN